MKFILRQAKALFILSRGSHELMEKYYAGDDDEYMKLNISPETEDEWREEMKANGVEPYYGQYEIQGAGGISTLYEARALFDLTNGNYFAMGYGYGLDSAYSEIVSDELHDKWYQDMIEELYADICAKETITARDLLLFCDKAEHPSRRDNFDRAMSLKDKIEVVSIDSKDTLATIILGGGYRNGLVYWAHRCELDETAKELMAEAKELLHDSYESLINPEKKDVIEADPEKLMRSIKYYQEKWQEVMDDLNLN